MSGQMIDSDVSNTQVTCRKKRVRLKSEIIHFTYSSRGGAGLAAHNLSVLLNQFGVKSRLKYRTTRAIPADVFRNPVRFASAVFDFLFVRRVSVSTIFSLYRSPGRPFQAKWNGKPILHFHWIPGVISVSRIAELAEVGYPVVVTLHDYWPMSGGCHFRNGCREIRNGCASCPQARPFFHSRIARSKEIKDVLTSFGSSVQFIAPSQWMADEALLAVPSLGARLHVVPNAIDLENFWPDVEGSTRIRSQEAASPRFTVGFAAIDINEKRKGLKNLLACIEALRHEADLDVGLRTCGAGQPQADFRWWNHIGSLSDRAELRRFYHECDLIVVPSLEDNLPTVAIEAGLCGIPALVSSRTGLRALLDNVEGGLAFETTEDLKERLKFLIQNREILSEYGRRFRAEILGTMGGDVVSSRHVRVYEQALQAAGGYE